MFSRNTVLIFCVALYFLRCQGGIPFPRDLETIRNAFVQYQNQDNSVDVVGLKKIIDDVAEKLGKLIRYPMPGCRGTSLGEMIEVFKDRKFTMDQVEHFLIRYLNFTFQDPQTTIREILEKHEKPDGLSYQELARVIDEVKEKTGVYNEFPSFHELQREAANYKYPMDVVEKIAQEFIASDDPPTKTIIREIVTQHYTSDGLSDEELKRVIDVIKAETGTTGEFALSNPLEATLA
ncbi:uncharacterized protein LOC126845300, partial [Adelges cooleyi]